MRRLFLVCTFVVSIITTASSMADELGKPFVQTGHSDTVDCVAMSSDGNWLASGGRDRLIKLWDIGSGKEIRTLKGHEDNVSSIAISSDGTFLASGDDDGFVKLWSVKDGSELHTMEVYQGSASINFVHSIAISPDDQLVAAGGYQGISVWSAKNGKLQRTLIGHKDRVLSVSFSPDGQWLASGSMDNTIKIWDVRTGKELFTLIEHKEGEPSNNKTDFYKIGVKKVVFTPDSRRLVSGGLSGVVKIWDLQSRETLYTMIRNDSEKNIDEGDGPIDDIDISSDGRWLISHSGYPEMETEYWNMQNGELIRHFKGFAGEELSPDDQWMLSVSGNGIRMQSTETDNILTNPSIETSGIAVVNFSPDGASLVFTSTGKVKLFDVVNVKVLRTVAEISKLFNGIAVSPDGRIVAVGDSDGDTTLWDVQSGEKLKTFGYESWDHSVTSVSFSPNGHLLAITSHDHRRNLNITVWDMKSGKKLYDISEKHHSSIVFSPDNHRIISAGRGGEIKVRDAHTGKVLRTLSGFDFGSKIDSIAISPDGRLLALGSGGSTAFLLDIQSGKLLHTTKHTKIYGQSVKVIFSQDGRWFASGSGDGAIKLWDVNNGELLRTLEGTRHGVNSLGLSKNNKVIVSGHKGGSLIFWDVASGHELGRYISFEDGEWVVITPEGYFDSSENGAKHLNVQTGPLTVSGVDAYYEQFYRPDIVKLAMAGERVDTGVRMADLKTPPRVEIIKTASTTNNNSIKVTLKITDQGGGVGDIRLYRNGTAIKLDDSRGLKLISKGQQDKALYKTYQVKLENGANELKAIAFDEKNWGRSEYAIHLVTAKIQARKPALHAVVIGIEKYRNKKLDLKFAEDDAVLFANSLKQYSKGLFSEIKVDLLTSRDDTTSESITARLTSMQNLNPQDLFVFYVASHGTVDDGAYYLITSNVGSTSTRKLKQDAISQETLKSLISNIPTSKKLIVLDTCNSQALGDSLQVAMMTRGMSEDTAMKVLSRAVGSTILSASTSTQEALEGYKGHGLFTYVLNEGLKGKADSNSDGFVKTSELSDYIEDTVPELAEKIFGREQFPSPARNGQSYPISKIQ